MQTTKYRIYHSEEGVPKAERAASSLSPAQVQRHLENLPTTLDLHFASSSIKVNVESLPDEPDCICVTLASDRTTNEMKSSLCQCIKNLNLRTPGLCLLIEEQ